MKRKTLTSTLLASVIATASAQVAVDAQPAVKGLGPFDLGPKLYSGSFKPAVSLGFTPRRPEPLTQSDSEATARAECAIGRIVKHVPYKSAAVHYSYSASGTERESQNTEAWTMQAGTLDDGQTALLDVIPDGFDAGGLAVPYTLQAGTLIVQPTFLGSTSQYNVFLFAYDDSWSSFDLRISLDGNGGMAVDPNLNIVYGAFTTDYFDIDAYQGYYESYSGVGYRKNVTLGDANEDARVDKADTQTLVGHLLGRSQENSDVDAMDTNADGYINVADIIGLSNIIKKQ